MSPTAAKYIYERLDEKWSIPALVQFKNVYALTWERAYTLQPPSATRILTSLSQLHRAVDELNLSVPPIQTITTTTRHAISTHPHYDVRVPNVRRKSHLTFSKNCYFVYQTPLWMFL